MPLLFSNLNLWWPWSKLDSLKFLNASILFLEITNKVGEFFTNFLCGYLSLSTKKAQSDKNLAKILI